MLEDVEHGLISTIIVKDMSRFGRNYILVGQYVEFVLPQYDVRVIGVSDNYDSYDVNNEMFAFESIFNELYAADISKKVRYAKHTLGMNGIEVKSRPIYGYKRKNGVYYDWEIDEEAAKVVRLIYDMFLYQDYCMNQIAVYLRNNRILTPSSYFGYKYTKVHSPYSWSQPVVRRILEAQEYCGDTINFKTKQVSFKLKNVIHIPKEEWIIFKNQHPAIVKREEFQSVQNKLKTAHKNSFSDNTVMKHDTFFRKKCYCAMCNNKMARGYHYGVTYNCRSYRVYRECESNMITENELRKVVLDHLRKLYHEIKNNKDAVLEKLGFNDISSYTVEIELSEERIKKIQELQLSAYEEYYHGNIDSDKFKALSESYADEKDMLYQKSIDLKRIVNNTVQRLKDTEKAIFIIENYNDSDFEELKIEMCDKLIEKIVIGKPAGQKRKNYGKRIIDVYIYNLGSISELVNVRYVKYSDRIKEIAPQLLLEGRCFQPVVSEILESGRGTIKDALAEEGTNFQTVIMGVKKEIIIDSIKKGLPVTEIYKLVGYSECSAVYWFIKRFLNTTYEELCRNIDNY